MSMAGLPLKNNHILISYFYAYVINILCLKHNTSSTRGPWNFTLKPDIAMPRQAQIKCHLIVVYESKYSVWYNILYIMILCGYDLSYKNDNDIGDLIVKLQG